MSTGRRAYDLLRGFISHEWERIQGVEETYAENELNEALGDPNPRAAYVPEPAVDKETRARQLLGVKPDADFADIRAAFENLSKRSDPANFPQGSPEARQAAEIQKRVHWAYAVLTEGIDTTEKRFKSLEID